MGTYNYLQILKELLASGEKTFTAKTCGYPTASLNAMASRGMIDKIGKEFYISVNSERFLFITNHLSPDGFVHLKKSDAELGMLCSMGKNSQLLDCRDKNLDWKEYDLYWDKTKNSWNKF